jgi:ABC-type polar amino acid transport system ATPase subunit
MVRPVSRIERHQPAGETARTLSSAGLQDLGKSTTIRCIQPPGRAPAGRIIVDGIHLNDDVRNIERVRTEVGMVFQHFNLFLT